MRTSHNELEKENDVLLEFFKERRISRRRALAATATAAIGATSSPAMAVSESSKPEQNVRGLVATSPEAT
jgi:hypothetical protein